MQPVPANYPVGDVVECLSADPRRQFRFEWQPPNVKHRYSYVIVDVVPQGNGEFKAKQINQSTKMQRQLLIKLPNG